jgi:MoxR-like ATPase
MKEAEYYLEKAKTVVYEVKKTVVGKDEAICKILMASLAKGHILIEDIPGVGKTTMARAFAATLGLECNRIQFTPDVMPSDLTGFNIYNRQTNCFEYKSGAVLCNILLADEINRTSPKTQSALLEAMEEGGVTVDGVSIALPNPFIVIATQNPFGSTGTQKLPESQLDRFMIKLPLGYPAVEEEVSILKTKRSGQNKIVSEKKLSPEEFLEMQEFVNGIYVDDAVYEYVARIAKATRESREIVQGLSPRGSIALIAMAKAEAFLRGHEYVLPADVQYVLPDVASHRIVVDSGLRSTRISAEEALKNIVRQVEVPKLKQ